MNSFGLAVTTNKLVTIESMEDLQGFSVDKDASYLFLGAGSNLLFCEDFQGTLVKAELLGKTVESHKDQWVVNVQAGESWHGFVRWCIEQSVYGLENLALIPGTVGAAPIQNIGAYGKEFCDYCFSVTAYDLERKEIVTLSKDECLFGYRDSIFKHAFKHTHLVLSVCLHIPKLWQPKTAYGDLKSLLNTATAKDIFELVCQVRKEKLPDPDEIGNAGSFFKNPVVATPIALSLKEQFPDMPCYATADLEHTKLAAGWLIDQCGLKGARIGGAAVHVKQALVIVNLNQAEPQDIVDLAWKVKCAVKEKFGVELEHEVRFIGANGETKLENLKRITV